MKASLVSFFAISMLLLTACSPQNRGSGASIRHQEARTSVGQSGVQPGGSSGDETETTLSAKCANGESAVGLIKEDGQSGSATFRQRVGDLVSASLDPQFLGEITGEGATGTGLDLYMRLKTDAQGKIDASSALQIAIYDSYVGTIDQDGKQVQPYPIVITKGASGSVDRTQKTFQVVFSDDYGSLTFQGTYDANVARGSVHFTNTRSFDGGAPRSGKLGTFLIPGCGIF